MTLEDKITGISMDPGENTITIHSLIPTTLSRDEAVELAFFLRFRVGQLERLVREEPHHRRSPTMTRTDEQAQTGVRDHGEAPGAGDMTAQHPEDRALLERVRDFLSEHHADARHSTEWSNKDAADLFHAVQARLSDSAPETNTEASTP